MPLAYGGSRTDAAHRCGGHAKIGFGAIFNYARLGAGTHTAVLFHNGVEFAQSTFTVGTVSSGRDFLDDVTARKEVQDFPEEDVTTVLEWNKATQHFEIVSEPAPQDLESPEAACRPTEGVCLENPSLGGNYSGIGVISGWKCSAVDLTARINGGPPFPVLYGNIREDTQKVCGDTDNGFVVPSWNWSRVGAGEHTIVVYDQETEFARATFTVGTAGIEFVEGVNRQITVFGFPYPLEDTDFEWNEATQHFEMIGGPGGGGGSGPPSFGEATIADQSYTPNTAITSLTLPQATGGTAPLVYSLSPALPAGLSFNQTTRELSGTPTSTLDATTYTYTATDAGGETATLTFTITVSAQPPSLSFGSATIAEQIHAQNAAIPSLTLPQATGGTPPLTYSLSPALPAGLSFNQTTRELSGTPTSTLDATTYTYTATDATGATAVLSFRMLVTPPLEEPLEETDDHQGNSTCSSGATRLYLGSSRAGEFETVGDIDCFQFSVPVQTEVIVYTTGDTDTEGSISGSLGLNDDDDGEDDNFQIVYTYNPGSYTINVSEYADDETGDYRLYVKADHADIRSGATYYERGRKDIFRQQRMRGRLSTLSDEDWFKIWIPSGVYQVEAWSTGSTDTEVYFYNHDGSYTGISDDDISLTNKNFRATLTNVRGAGWLYLRVMGGGGLRSNDIGNYDIHIRW